MIKDKTPGRALIRDKSTGQPLIDAEILRKALGAEEIHRDTYLSGSPSTLQALRKEIVRRLKSKGGRPSLEGTDHRVKIPIAEEDWEELSELAKSLPDLGHSVSPGQIASILLHREIEQLGSLSKSRMIGASPPLVGGVPGLEEFRANAYKILQEREALDVDGVVEWARRYPKLERLWIIAPEFQDNEVSSILDEVVHNIKERNVLFTYFVRAEDIEEHGRFTELKNRIAAQVGDLKAQSNVRAVPLWDDDLMWLQTDHVIANHHRLKETVGFQFIRHSNKPAVAIRMEDSQLVAMIKSLEPWIKEREHSRGRVVPMKKRD